MTKAEASDIISERTGGTWSADQTESALHVLAAGGLSKISLGTSYGWLMFSRANGYEVVKRQRR